MCGPGHGGKVEEDTTTESGVTIYIFFSMQAFDVECAGGRRERHPMWRQGPTCCPQMRPPVGGRSYAPRRRTSHFHAFRALCLQVLCAQTREPREYCPVAVHSDWAVHSDGGTAEHIHFVRSTAPLPGHLRLAPPLRNICPRYISIKTASSSGCPFPMGPYATCSILVRGRIYSCPGSVWPPGGEHTAP